MTYDADISPGFVLYNKCAPYSSSIATAASSSATSVWSDTASQSSDDTSLSSSSDPDTCDPYFSSLRSTSTENLSSLRRGIAQQHFQQANAVSADLRRNPRRTSTGNSTRTGCPPPLVRQCDRKVNFVDSLVDSSTQIVETIWPLSSVPCRNELGSKAVLPLRTFIQETLRRSRTSYSTLQVALYYLILIKPHVPKRNFTMEQTDERQSDRALQCGRRMFLAALILASKYLQDRNYSARAWSKISGLNTLEINQNEISFLLAVNWKLHITDEVFQRWTEIVLNYTPPPPPSPGSMPQSLAQQSLDWKQLILKLNPDLSNIEGLISSPGLSEPRSVPSPDSIDLTPTPRSYGLPTVATEPVPTSYATTPGRLAPTLGLLPTPRLTPQTSGFCTPAASAASHILGKSSAMGMAMAQASTVNSTYYMDRLPVSVTSSPQSYCPARRSSLANSMSTASSPESMISDSSRSSRSSSISSISSLASANANSKLAPRFRAAKLLNERSSLRSTIPSVPEDYDNGCLSASPESYTGPVRKLGDLCLDTPLARREHDLQGMVRDAASDAARTLQELHGQRFYGTDPPSGAAHRSSLKRGRTFSLENPLQDNVRDILHTRRRSSLEPVWPETLVQSTNTAMGPAARIPVCSSFTGVSKRLCCSAEAVSGYQAVQGKSSINFRTSGMWNILN